MLEARPFEVWGGAQLRDLTYVDDVTDAFLRAAVHPGCHGRIFNIGGVAPRRCASWRSWWCGWRARRRTTRPASSRPTGRSIDIGSYHADDRAFRAATGWAPTVGLEEGIARTLDWYRPRLADYL